MKNKDITIYGDGIQTRSFFVDNLVDDIIKIMNSRKDFLILLNIGNPEEFASLDFAKKMIKLTNSESKIIYKPIPEYDAKRKQPNIELANTELKWKPKIQLVESFKKTFNYFGRLLDNEK